MKKYIRPEITILNYNVDDILTTSSGLVMNEDELPMTSFDNWEP